MKFFYLRFLPTLLFAVALATDTFAQANRFITYIQAGAVDGSKLTSAYLNPVMEGFTYGVNGGWSNTAHTHDRLGFDISISATGIFFPSSATTFRPAELGLTNTTLVGGNGVAPTIVGPENSTVFETTLNTPGGPETINFSGAPGLDFANRWLVKGITVPMFQAAVGIGKKTDAKLRFIPTVGLGSVTRAGLVGLGFQHDIKQHIKAWSEKDFDLSLFAGYTRVAGEIQTAVGDFPPAAGDTRAQETPFKVHAFLVQALISKQLEAITFYGGVGYNVSKSNAEVLGSYVIFGDGTDNEVVLTDPLHLSFNDNSMRVTAGARLQIGHFCIYGDYTLQQRSAVTVGIGYTTD
ncbi:MAG TPA: DUF6588 family protein [Cyclobacteriaceae bacterium]